MYNYRKSQYKRYENRQIKLFKTGKVLLDTLDDNSTDIKLLNSLLDTRYNKISKLLNHLKSTNDLINDYDDRLPRLRNLKEHIVYLEKEWHKQYNSLKDLIQGIEVILAKLEK